MPCVECLYGIDVANPQQSRSAASCCHPPLACLPGTACAFSAVVRPMALNPTKTGAGGRASMGGDASSKGPKPAAGKAPLPPIPAGGHAPAKGPKAPPPPMPKAGSWTLGLPLVGSTTWPGGHAPTGASSSAGPAGPKPPPGPPPQWAVPSPIGATGAPMAPPFIDPRAGLKVAEESDEEAGDALG